MLNLDTHILIKTVEATLTPSERIVLTEDPAWGISAVVLWEIEKLYEIGRLRYGLDHPPLTAALDCIRIWPISREVCRNLRALDFQSDPADELIAATSLTYQVPLVTRDVRIRASQVVRCV